jgi:chemotaxis protein histidine kinase CheA
MSDQEEPKATECTAVVAFDKSNFLITGIRDEEHFRQLLHDRENFREVIQAIKDASNLVADPTTKDGQIAIKTLAGKLGDVYRDFKARKMEISRKIKEEPKLIDATTKVFLDTVDECKTKVLQPLVDIEEREAKLVEIENLVASATGCNSEAVKDILEQINAMDQSESFWKETHTKSIEVFAETKRQLTEMLTTALAKEEKDRQYEIMLADKARVDRILSEQKARDEERAIAAKAAKEKEEADARRAKEKEAQDAKDRAAFEDKVKREAAEAIEKEKKRLQEQADAEKPKEFAVDFETLQVETHVAKPHAPAPTPTPDGKKLAAEDLISLFAMSESRASQVVEAIATGRVRNLNYKENA